MSYWYVDLDYEFIDWWENIFDPIDGFWVVDHIITTHSIVWADNNFYMIGIF